MHEKAENRLKSIASHLGVTPTDPSSSYVKHNLRNNFPQAESARLFPPPVHDAIKFEKLLSHEEIEMRDSVRKFMEREVAPIIADYWDRAEFPFHLIPGLQKLGIGGLSCKAHSSKKSLSLMASGLIIAEVARVDCSLSTFLLVHASLAMTTIEMLGSEAQKSEFLPKLASLDLIACWALTEPDHGSDASSISTTATKVIAPMKYIAFVDEGYLLNGNKRWIGNGTFANILVIWARNSQTNQVLAVSRLMVAWQPVGIAWGVYDMCVRYVQERKQFGSIIGSFQLIQERLVRMHMNIQAMVLLVWRLTKLQESGKMSHGLVSSAKAWNTLRVRETVALGREILGGNGVVTDFHVAKAFCDLEAIYTYEGTYDVNCLVGGREIVGVSAIKPPKTREKERK